MAVANRSAGRLKRSEARPAALILIWGITLCGGPGWPAGGSPVRWGSTALPLGRLIYNNRTDGSFGPLWDSTSILYVRSTDLDINGKLKPGLASRPEPLILRALAGECIKLTLRNKLPDTLNELDGYNTLPMIVENFNANDIRPSNVVGLHPQLLYYDVSRFDGTMVGRNKDQLVKPGQFGTYEWYAGRRLRQRGRLRHRHPDRVRRHQPDLLRSHRAREQGGDRRADHRASERLHQRVQPQPARRGHHQRRLRGRVPRVRPGLPERRQHAHRPVARPRLLPQ